jgi:stringent starvation protein A
MAIPKKASITLYTGMDMRSHRVRLALSEKQVSYDVIFVDEDHPSLDLQEINPHNNVPTLVDRGDLIINQSHVIVEYLDERFPHPPLLPIYPIARARARLMIFRIEQDWYRLAHLIEQSTDAKRADRYRHALREQLLKLLPAFARFDFFLSQDFSLVDCTIAPLLWRLPYYKIELGEEAAPIMNYAKRIFERSSFKSSILDVEHALGAEDETS